MGRLLSAAEASGIVDWGAHFVVITPPTVEEFSAARIDVRDDSAERECARDRVRRLG